MTELQFLIELLLNHKLVKVTKDAISGRIKEVEEGLSRAPSYHPQLGTTTPNIQFQQPPQVVKVNGVQQAGSMAAKIAAMEAEKAGLQSLPAPQMEQATGLAAPVPSPVAVIAQTHQTAQALASRNAAINQALSGKEEKGAIAPRKW